MEFNDYKFKLTLDGNDLIKCDRFDAIMGAYDNVCKSFPDSKVKIYHCGNLIIERQQNIRVKSIFHTIRFICCTQPRP